VEMIRAVNEGVPVVTGRPSSPVALSLHKMAQALVGIQSEAKDEKAKQRRRSIFRR
jgi:MinD-like ATPase involved in chromosome partitioning or flagellar assembly